jgi:putative tricarboxylic transport membrane protein
VRAGFLLALLLAASAYTWLAFSGLDYLSSAGRLGPGFFPRIIGVALVVLCLESLFRDRGLRDSLSPHWRTVLVVAALSAAYIAVLEPLGGLIAMILFMAGALAFLNRGRPLQNAILALVLPAGLYLLFKVWLGAALPRGLLPLL